MFDLDGVLADSTPAVTRVWTIWATKHGFDPEETVHRAHGRPSIATIRELLPKADHDAENSVVEAMEIEDVEGVVPLPGAVELLKALPPERWTIVTSCTRRLALRRLRVAGIPIPAKFVSSNDISKGKPNPEPYLKGAEILGIAPADCVVLEDAPAGIRAGKSAGSRVIALQTTERDPLLLAAGADWIVKDLGSIQVCESEGSDGVSLLAKNIA